jgi:hypothetical protein
MLCATALFLVALGPDIYVCIKRRSVVRPRKANKMMLWVWEIYTFCVHRGEAASHRQAMLLILLHLGKTARRNHEHHPVTPNQIANIAEQLPLLLDSVFRLSRLSSARLVPTQLLCLAHGTELA